MAIELATFWLGVQFSIYCATGTSWTIYPHWNELFSRLLLVCILMFSNRSKTSLHHGLLSARSLARKICGAVVFPVALLPFQLQNKFLLLMSIVPVSLLENSCPLSTLVFSLEGNKNFFFTKFCNETNHFQNAESSSAGADAATSQLKVHPVTYFAVLWTIEACFLILNFRIGIFGCPEKFVICTEFDWTKKRCRFCFWLCVFFPLQLSMLFFCCIIVWLFLERNLIIAHLDHLLSETQTVFDTSNSFWYKLIIPIKLNRRKPKSSSAGFGPAISGLEVQRAIHCSTMDSAMMKRFCIELSSRLVVFLSWCN